MGVKKIAQSRILNSVAIGDSETVSSDPINIQNLDNIGFQFVWTGNPVGDFHIYGSSSYELPDAPAVWTDLSISTDIITLFPDGSAGDLLIPVLHIGFAYLYVSYVPSAGSGTLDVFYFGKDNN